MGRKSSLVPWFLAARFVDKQFPPFYRDERAANNETINFRYTFSRIKGKVSIVIRVYPFILSCSEFPCGISYIPENRGTSQRKIVSKHIALMGETLMPELDLFFRYSLLIKILIFTSNFSRTRINIEETMRQISIEIYIIYIRFDKIEITQIVAQKADSSRFSD